MKINKLFAIGTLLLSAVAFTACSDDDDYQWATANGEQVYFSNELDTTVEISPDTNAVVIPVERINTKGELTVPLTITGADGTPYSVPTSVTFADGASEAKLSIGYDPNEIGTDASKKIQYGDYKHIEAAIDPQYATNYGISTFKFQIGITDWGDWDYYYAKHSSKEPGCTYLYSLFLSGSDTLTLYVRQNKLNSDLLQFKAEHFFDMSDDRTGGVDLVIDVNKATGTAAVHEPTATGYDWSTYGIVYIADYTNYWRDLRGQSSEHWPTGSYNAETGIIAIPVAYYVSAGCAAQGYEYIYLDGYVRADYSTDVSYLGRLIDESDSPAKVYFNVTLGDDVESAQVAILPGEVAALDSATLASIVDGTYTPMATTEASGEVSIDASSLTEGTYTVVVVPIAGKEAQEDGITYKTFKYTLSGAELFDEVAAGTLTLGAADISSIVSSDGSSWGTLLTALGSDTPSMTQEAVLSKSRTDETHYKLSPFWQDGYDLDFHVDNEGYITVAGIDTGIGGSDGNVMAYDFSNVFKRYTLAQLNQIGIASTLNGDTYTFNLYYKDNSYAYAAETETFEVTATGAKSLKAAKRGGVKLIGKTLNNNARFLKSFNGKILSAGNLKGHHLR